MNLQRGMQRGWIAVSVIWVILLLIVWRAGAAFDLDSFAKAAFLPPLALAILMWLIGWVIEGFRGRR